MTLNIDTFWTKTLNSMKTAAKMSRLSYAVNADFTYLPYEQRLNFGMNYRVLAEVTTGDWNAFKMKLTELHNIDYREYAYAQYVEQVARFMPHPFITVDTAALVKSLTEAKAAFKAGQPNAYAIRVKEANRKADNELMVTLPVELAGYAIEVSYEYLLDLLYVFKRCKVKTLKLRIEPLANGASSDKRSVLKLVDGKDVYSLYSGTALDLTPLPEPTPDFTLYDTPAMPGGDAAPFPAAYGPYRALAIVPATCKAIVVYTAPVDFIPAKVDPCELCGEPSVKHVDGHALCDICAAKLYDYEQRLNRRVDRLRSAADKASAEAEATWSHARKMADVIPFGQPILVGHHSERADRRYRDRIWNMYGRAAGLSDKSKHYEQRAHAAEKNRAISSDDPAAVLKLQDKIDAAKARQAHMKLVNATIRKNAKKSHDEQIAALLALEVSPGGLVVKVTEAGAERMLKGDFLNRKGFPDYELTNNNANIRRMEQRVKELRAAAQRAAAAEQLKAQALAELRKDPQDMTRADMRHAAQEAAGLREQHGDVMLHRDYDANRIRLHFPGKPSRDVIKALKHHGFVWSPSNMAWQRQLNSAGEYAASCILKRLNPPLQRFQVGQVVKVLDNPRMPSLVGLVGTIEQAQNYDNGDIEYRVAFPEFGDWLNDNELALHE